MKQRPVFNVMLTLLVVTLFSVGNAYSLDGRYTKLDASGAELSNDAKEWAITFDSSTGLYWEVKSASDDIHSKDGVYSYSKAKKNFIAKLNEENFGGFSDWRLPTLQELTKLREKGDETPYINQEAYPNTVPSEYICWELCGNGEITPRKVKFGKQKAKKRSSFVRAVRGASPAGSDRW